MGGRVELLGIVMGIVMRVVIACRFGLCVGMVDWILIENDGNCALERRKMVCVTKEG